MKSSELRIEIDGKESTVGGLLLHPNDCRALYVMAHGAGAGMRHPFLETLSNHLAERGIATLRYQFSYMERGSRRPDSKPALLATVRAAIACAREHARGVPIVAGGKSMGGRMTSLAAAEAPLEGVRGLVFLGFPLHPAGKPGEERASHLTSVSLPMLFLQGTRDTLAELARIQTVCAGLGTKAQLHVVDGGDHSFHVLRSCGRNDADVQRELADRMSSFVHEIARAMPQAQAHAFEKR